MATLSVRVKPGARTPGIRLEADFVEVRVRAPAQEGRANDAVRDALAAALGVATSTVALVRGATARHKVFEIRGLTRENALARLAARGSAAATSKKPVDDL